MVQYATAEELASYMQQTDLDLSSTNLVLQLASGQFSQAADTWFEPTTVTYTTSGTTCTAIKLPFRPVRSVDAVRINGVAVSGWALRRNTVYRQAGFGTGCTVPPDEVAIDLTHGEDAPGDDVKAVVLETAATAFTAPVGALLGERLDDYEIRVSAADGGIQLTQAASDLAKQYRGTFAA